MTVRKIVLATFGTHGDLHPFIAIGMALRQHGFEAVVATTADFREDVEAAGLAFHPLRPSQDLLQTDLAMSRAEMLRTAKKNPQIILTRLVLPYLRQTYDDAMLAVTDAQLIITSSLAFGAKFAAQKLGLAHIAVVLQPSALLSSFDPPVLGNAAAISRLAYAGGYGTTRAFLQLGRWVSRVWARPIRKFRQQIGLPRTSVHPLFEGQFIGATPVGLYSHLLGDIQPDFPPGFIIAGFAFYDGLAKENAVDSGLQSFMDRGQPPLIFTQGTSAIHDSDGFVNAALVAINRLGERAVLVLDETQRNSLRGRISDNIFVSGYVAYSRAFPGAKAIIHHGGIGTTAQALKSGLPQLITPYFVDQPDNAARVQRLGVARVVPLERWTASKVMEELTALLGDSKLAARAKSVGHQISRENGATEVAQLAMQMLKA